MLRYKVNHESMTELIINVTLPRGQVLAFQNTHPLVTPTLNQNHIYQEDFNQPLSRVKVHFVKSPFLGILRARIVRQCFGWLCQSLHNSSS